MVVVSSGRIVHTDASQERASGTEWSAGLKRPGKTDKVERLCFDWPFERRSGVSHTAGVVEGHPQ